VGEYFKNGSYRNAVWWYKVLLEDSE
jgi:hypothetical protein